MTPHVVIATTGEPAGAALEDAARAVAAAGARVTVIGIGREPAEREAGGVRYLAVAPGDDAGPPRRPRPARTIAFDALRRVAGAPPAERLARTRAELADGGGALRTARAALLRARSLNHLEREVAPRDATERALVPAVAGLLPDAVHAYDAAAAPAARRAAVLAGAAPSREISVARAAAAAAEARVRRRPSDRARLGVGPRNLHDQASAWSRAAAAHLPGVEAESFGFELGGDRSYPADVRIAYEEWLAPDWQDGWAERVVSTYSHVLCELALSPLGRLRGEHVDAALPYLRRHGVAAAIVARGSEARDPRAHAALEPDSPFARDDRLTRRLQAQADALLPRLRAFDGPRFVSTADLTDYLPDATWLPLVVDLDRWRAEPPPLERRVPVVVHATTRGALKHTAAVDAACGRLAERGAIAYQRLEGVPPAEMPARLAGADIVLDQFALGDYGGLACQAMAAGRCVIGHVRDEVRARLPAPLPIVEARVHEIAPVLERVLEDRAAGVAAAADGRRYVEAFHDGRYAAAQLAPFLGVAAP